MAKGIITYSITDDGRAKGLTDKLAYILWKLKAYKVHGTWHIIKTGQVYEGFYYIDGPKYIVKFLSWITGSPFSKGMKIVVSTDDADTICRIEDHKGV